MRVLPSREHVSPLQRQGSRRPSANAQMLERRTSSRTPQPRPCLRQRQPQPQAPHCSRARRPTAGLRGAHPQRKQRPPQGRCQRRAARLTPPPRRPECRARPPRWPRLLRRSRGPRRPPPRAWVKPEPPALRVPSSLHGRTAAAAGALSRAKASSAGLGMFISTQRQSFSDLTALSNGCS